MAQQTSRYRYSPKLQVNGLTFGEAITHIKKKRDAVHFCAVYCPRQGELGCAVDCKLRMKFGIPPHGTSFEG